VLRKDLTGPTFLEMPDKLIITGQKGPQGLRGKPKENVLVPRFFLTFPLLDVPYISRGCGRHFPLVFDGPRVTVEFFLTFLCLDVP
jgi:hypothetical protein